MGRGVRYHDLTLAQLCRLVACERKESECADRILTRDAVAEALEVTQVGRFIREMIRRGWMCYVHRPATRGRKGQRSTFRMTAAWHGAAVDLRGIGVLPDLCAHPGCGEQALPFRFRGQFWCREHLQGVHCAGCTRRDEDGRCPRLRPLEGRGDDHGA